MLNFAEQTGSGAVIVVWSFLIARYPLHIGSPIASKPTNYLTQKLIIHLIIYISLLKKMMKANQAVELTC
jgi:hypothetical protein